MEEVIWSKAITTKGISGTKIVIPVGTKFEVITNIKNDRENFNYGSNNYATCRGLGITSIWLDEFKIIEEYKENKMVEIPLIGEKYWTCEISSESANYEPEIDIVMPWFGIYYYQGLIAHFDENDVIDEDSNAISCVGPHQLFKTKYEAMKHFIERYKEYIKNIENTLAEMNVNLTRAHKMLENILLKGENYVN